MKTKRVLKTSTKKHSKNGNEAAIRSNMKVVSQKVGALKPKSSRGRKALKERKNALKIVIKSFGGTSKSSPKVSDQLLATPNQAKGILDKEKLKRLLNGVTVQYKESKSAESSPVEQKTGKKTDEKLKMHKENIQKPIIDKDKLKKILNGLSQGDATGPEVPKKDVLNKDKLRNLLSKVQESESSPGTSKGAEPSLAKSRGDPKRRKPGASRKKAKVTTGLKDYKLRNRGGPQGSDDMSSRESPDPEVVFTRRPIAVSPESLEAGSFDKIKLKQLIVAREQETTVSEASPTPKMDTGGEIKMSPFSISNELLKSNVAGKAMDGCLTLRGIMIDRLNAARFRYINEQLYCSTGEEAQKFFESDPEAFAVYHQGYQSQVSKWPICPLDVIIDDIARRKQPLVVADFGCGEAKLAKSVPNKVHSFDLVAANEHVTACNMAKVPLKNTSVDIAVFCLSLMGTNLSEYLKEANRILKMGGILKIAEVESRFENVEYFIKQVEKLGFSLTKQDTGVKMFVFLDFTKVKNFTSKKPVSVMLHPCLYKKR